METILAGLEKEGKEKFNRIDRISADIHKKNSGGMRDQSLTIHEW